MLRIAARGLTHQAFELIDVARGLLAEALVFLETFDDLGCDVALVLRAGKPAREDRAVALAVALPKLLRDLAFEQARQVDGL